MKVGDIFYISDRGVNTHLCVVISDPDPDDRLFVMSVLCQMAWSGKNTLRKRSVTVGTISNSATPPRVTSIAREKTRAPIGQLSVCQVALFPFLPLSPFCRPRSSVPGDRPYKAASLHAKCIVVDKGLAFVSSANFTEAAQTKNIEVGVLIRSPAFARRLSEHFEILASTCAVKPVPLSSQA